MKVNYFRKKHHLRCLTGWVLIAPLIVADKIMYLIEKVICVNLSKQVLKILPKIFDLPKNLENTLYRKTFSVM